MNILISSVGKRVGLVQTFLRAINELNVNSKVFGLDMNPEMAPARFVTEQCFKAPRVTSVDFKEELFKICLQNNIKLIIPTIDTELLVYSELREELMSHGIQLALSEVSLIKMCRDKRLTNDLFKSKGIRCPRKMSLDQDVFPIFAKPYDGSLSRDLYLINSKKEISTEITNNKKLMFMEYLSPETHQEFTVDAYYSKENKLCCLVPRERLEVRAGEINKGRTNKGGIYKYLINKLEIIEGARGCLTIQFFQNINSGEITAIEINARFGGGYPLTDQSGASYSKWLIQEYLLGKKTIWFDDWKDNLTMIRFDDAFYF